MFGAREWGNPNPKTAMRVYRHARTALARHVRATSARHALSNSSYRCSVSLRFEPSASRCMSTSGALTTPPRSSPSTQPSAGQAFLPSEPSPGLAVLQTLTEWTSNTSPSSGPIHGAVASVHAPHHAKEANGAEGKRPSLIARNRALRKAIEKGDFVRAQQALQALVLPWDPSREAHPVDTENYDRLLFKWSQHCAKRVLLSGPTQVDLTPMLALLEAMVAWKRVNARSFNTALVACQRVRALDAGERVLEMMKRSSRQPKAFAYTSLITCCAQLTSKHKGRQDHFVNDAERFFEELVEGGTGVTIEAVNAMLFAYRAARGRSHAAVELVERAVREWGLHPDSSTIAPLVVCLLKDKNSLEATRWIEYALNHRVAVDDAIVRTVMDECRRSAQWDKLDSLRLLLQERGVAQKDHELKQVLRKGRVRDAESDAASSVLHAAPHKGSSSKKAQKSEAASTLKNVIERIQGGQRVHLGPSQWADVFEHGNIEELDKLMQLLYSPNLKRHSAIPLHRINEMYFRALGFAGQWWRIVRELDIILQKAPQEVQVDSFNSAMRGCTRANRLHEALRVLERMERTSVRPNRQTYDTLLQCCGSTGSVESAVQLFHEMERSGIEPRTLDLNAVLKAFATTVQRLIEASQDESIELEVPASDLNKLAVHSLHFFEDVTATYERIEITETSVVHLFRSFLGAAEVFDAVDIHEFEAFTLEDDHSDHESRAEWILLTNAVQQICREAPLNVVTSKVINVGIDFFQRRGEPNSAFELFNTMISRGISPTPDTIRLLFSACCSGDEDTQLGLFFLDHVLASMNGDDESDMSRTIASESLRWAARMSSGSREAGSDLVDIVLDKLTDSGVLKKDDSAYSRVMAVFGHDGNVVQAQRMVERMLSETGSVSVAVASRLLQACSVSRAPIAALNALGWMRRHGLQPDLASYNNVLSAIRRHQERNQAESGHEEGGDNVVDEEDNYEDGDDDYDEDDGDDSSSVDVGDEGSDSEIKSRQMRLSRFETDFNAVLDSLLAAMHEEGVLPDARTFECLVSIASLRGEVRRLLELFDSIKAAAELRNVDISALLLPKTVHFYLDGCTAVASAGDTSNAASRVEEIGLLLASWYRDRSYAVSSSTLLRILSAYDALGQWQNSVALVKNAMEEFGVAPNVEMFRAVMETCNHAGQHKAVEQIFATMQKPGGPSGKLFPTAACYIEAIYAVEQQGNWIQATQLFMEMQKKCAAEDLHPSLLNRIALGRYAEGRKRPD